MEKVRKHKVIDKKIVFSVEGLSHEQLYCSDYRHFLKTLKGQFQYEDIKILVEDCGKTISTSQNVREWLTEFLRNDKNEAEFPIMKAKSVEKGFTFYSEITDLYDKNKEKSDKLVRKIMEGMSNLTPLQSNPRLESEEVKPESVKQPSIRSEPSLEIKKIEEEKRALEVEHYKQMLTDLKEELLGTFRQTQRKTDKSFLIGNKLVEEAACTEILRTEDSISKEQVEEAKTKEKTDFLLVDRQNKLKILREEYDFSVVLVESIKTIQVSRAEETVIHLKSSTGKQFLVCASPEAIQFFMDILGTEEINSIQADFATLRVEEQRESNIAEEKKEEESSVDLESLKYDEVDNYDSQSSGKINEFSLGPPEKEEPKKKSMPKVSSERISKAKINLLKDIFSSKSASKKKETVVAEFTTQVQKKDIKVKILTDPVSIAIGEDIRFFYDVEQAAARWISSQESSGCLIKLTFKNGDDISFALPTQEQMLEFVNAYQKYGNIKVDEVKL